MILEYKNPVEAYELAGERMEDTTLQTRIAEYLGDVWPEGFEESREQQAVYAPYLARGSELEVQFTTQALETGFRPTIATYKASEFVTANPAAVDCYRSPLKLPRGQQTREWVVPVQERYGSIGQADTIYDGLNIEQYWAGIRAAVMTRNFGDDPTRVTDFGDWYTTQAQRFGWSSERSKADKYYKALMALYSSGRAVLWAPPPSRFTSEVTAPAVAEIEEKLGVGPLITCELRPDKRDWVNLSFLSQTQTEALKRDGRVE